MLKSGLGFESYVQVEGREEIIDVVTRKQVTVVGDREKFKELKSILKAHFTSPDAAVELYPFYRKDIRQCSMEQMPISKTATIDMLYLRVEYPPFGRAYGEVVAVIRLIEKGEMKVFSEVIHLDRELLNQFKGFCHGLHQILETKDRKIYHELPENHNKAPRATKQLSGKYNLPVAKTE